MQTYRLRLVSIFLVMSHLVIYSSEQQKPYSNREIQESVRRIYGPNNFSLHSILPSFSRVNQSIYRHEEPKPCDNREFKLSSIGKKPNS